MIAIDSGARTVGDVMTPDPVVVSVDCPLAEVAELLEFYSISGLPVLDWSGFLAGVISQTDLVRAEASESLSSSWSRLAVRDVMTRPALTVPRGAGLEEAARLMTQQKIHRLVVVDADDEPVGVVSISDLVRAMAEGSEAEAGPREAAPGEAADCTTSELFLALS
jgi:CBS domain-containing protein